MNFLAHFHLAWPDEGLIAGGLEGDYHRGLLRGQLHPGVERGVKLHRAIDAHTDNHPLIIELRKHFPAEIRRYAGILIELSFDHYLTRHWSSYSSVPLRQFTSAVHDALSTLECELSPGSRTMLSRMREYDILNRYDQWSTVPAAAARIGERFRRGNPLLEVEAQLQPLQPQLEETFLQFYPQLLSFSEKHQLTLN